MFKNYLKITFRSLWKNKGFVITNVLGLGIAIACCIVAYLNFNYNQQFDTEHKNAEKIYRLNSERTFNSDTRKLGFIPRPMGELVRENIADVDKVANFSNQSSNVRIEDEYFRTRIAYVDPEFTKIFTFQLVEGQYNLDQLSNIYLSEQLAHKYFGNEEAVGKTITQVLDSGVIDYQVAGVFKDKPSNSSFMFVEAFTNYKNYFRSNDNADEDDWQAWVTTFVTVDDKGRLSTIEKQLQDYIAPQNKAREDFQITRYYVDPFQGMAIRDEKQNVGSTTREGLPSAAVVAPFIMSGLILLLACFNFTNTSIAISGKRLKEIGLRKVMGGVRSQLIRQFLSENIILCIMALLVGLIIAEFLVPAYSQMWEFIDIELNYTENVEFFLFLIGLLAFTGLIAGSYPAFYISKFEPASILKGTQKFGGTSPFTRILLTLQLTIALLGVISAFAFVKNASYQKNFDLGYEGDGIIHVAFNNGNEYEVYRNAVVNDPKVQAYSGSTHQLMESYRNDPVRYEDREEEVDILSVDENYLKTMDMKLIAGRNFEPDSKNDQEESIIITQEMAKVFGWEEPLGKRIVWADTVALYVVGVVEDVYTNALWAPLEPLMLRYADESDFRFLTIKSKPSEVIETNEYLKRKWNEIFPNQFYTGEYINIEVSEAASVNNNILKLFLFLGIVATLLAISGLFTLVSLNIIKRMKEIAVRKVLGASIIHIVGKLNKQFIIIMLIAIVLSSVVSYYAISGLMASIWTYHVNLDVVLFLISGLVFLAIAMLTISFKVFGAATMNPVNALRNE
ncbi:MAG: ABC transporter permease [Fulvivirga sp.]|nr:ABC transporter permease [Fulvivirga sp.]